MKNEDRITQPQDWSRLDAGPVTFSNEPLTAADLPDFRRVTLEPVSPRFAPYALLSAALFWLIVILITLLGPRLAFVDLMLPLWLPAVPALGLVWFGSVAWLDAQRRGWVVRDHDLIYRSGLIWRRTAILPFARIQHVETASGPLERAFGLMRVKCFTAGGMSADLTVEGLEGDAARRVRQYLLEQIRDDDATEPGSGGSDLA